MEWLKIFQIGKIPTRIVLLICITSCLLLFLPIAVIKKMQLESFIVEYGKYIGIAFISSTGFLLLGFFGWLLKQFSSWINNVRYRSKITEYIATLDSQEKAILREFIFSDSSTLPLPMQEAAVAGLIGKRIIYQVSSYGGMNFGEITFNYAISPTARKKITYASIGAPNKSPSEFTKEDQLWLQNNRPNFINNSRPLW